MKRKERKDGDGAMKAHNMKRKERKDGDGAMKAQHEEERKKRRRWCNESTT